MEYIQEYKEYIKMAVMSLIILALVAVMVVVSIRPSGPINPALWPVSDSVTAPMPFPPIPFGTLNPDIFNK